MNGAGHNDAAKMAAARELAMSFKKGGSGSDAPRGRKKNKTRATSVNRVENIPPPRPHMGLPLSTNVPLPSQRRYEDSLSANPFQRGPGPIMGSRAMDFLNRQDTPKPTAVTPSPVQPRPVPVAPMTVPSAPKLVTSSQQKHATSNVASNFVEIAECTNTAQKQAVTSIKPIVSQVAQGVIRSSTTDRPSGMPTVSACNPVNQQEPLRQTIRETFFSLIEKPHVQGAAVRVTTKPKVEGTHITGTATNQLVSGLTQAPRLDRSPNRSAPSNMPEEKPLKIIPNATNSSVTNASTSIHQETSTILHTDRRAQLMDVAPPVLGSGKDGLVPNLRTVGGKTGVRKSSEGFKQLRPEAPGFIPRPVINSDAISGPFNDNSVGVPSPLYNSTVAHGNFAHVMNLPSEDALHSPFIVLSGPSSGHLVNVTLVQFANGVLIPGHTNGRHCFDSPPNTVAQRNISKISETSNIQVTQKKPVKGLGGSIWAK